MPVAKPLIVGAGPTGLAAALFLARRGIEPRIVEKAGQPTRKSKALGVNPRTLQILEESGVTDQILQEGLAVRQFNFFAEGKPLTHIELPYAAMGAKHPMTILPQARTEALLRQALQAEGVKIERGKPLISLTQDADQVSAHVGDNEVRAPLLLAADGAHSVARHALELGFPGESMPEGWRLMDAELEGPPQAQGWIDFRKDGPFVALPMPGGVWRLIGFGRPLEERIPADWTLGKVLWSSEFSVSHRVVERMNVGRICLAGDAAHIHSPIGARGMNLGIEDAYVWAACADHFLQGDRTALEKYSASRLKFDRAVVARVERLTRNARATSGSGVIFRNTMLRILGRIKPVQVAIARQAVGLDHPLVIP